MTIGLGKQANHGDSDRRPDAPVVLSPAYLSALSRVEALPSNQDHADKSWVYAALDDVRQHFAKVQRA